MLSGAAYNSRLRRFWKIISWRFSHVKGAMKVSYLTNALLVAVNWGEILSQEELERWTLLHANRIVQLFEKDETAKAMYYYILYHGWEKSGSPLMFDEDGDLVCPSTVTDLLLAHNLLPLFRNVPDLHEVE